MEKSIQEVITINKKYVAFRDKLIGDSEIVNDN